MSLTPNERAVLQYGWWFWARKEQITPPGDWFVWLCLAGRGWGKSRVIAEWVREQVQNRVYGRLALVAATAADVRDVMIFGESGIMAVSPPWFRPEYHASKRRLVWPNGAIATCYSAEEPDRLRGPQHDAAACDELCLVGGTLIYTEEGPRPIEKVRPGDWVHTRKGLRRITNCAITKPIAEVWRMKAVCGRSLVGTAGHPVHVEGKDFVPLSKLEPGDVLTGYRKDRTIVVQSLIKLVSMQRVYNVEVEDQHEYYANGILTHNCAWQYPETWDQMMFGLRLGKRPRIVVATTPRPKTVLKELVAANTTYLTKGSTYDNLENLAPVFKRTVLDKYEGTTKGKQEIWAEILSEAAGALWKRQLIDDNRALRLPQLKRIVVGVDPAVSDAEDSCNTGIVVVGYGEDCLIYVLEDATLHAHVNDWARAVVVMYQKWEADFVVGEVNNGGDLVESVIKAVDATVAFKKVHASRGKRTRAEPVAMLYEKGQVKHYGAGFKHLEDEMVGWDPMAGGKSPDRVDALVWAISQLMQTKPVARPKRLLGISPARVNPYGAV